MPIYEGPFYNAPAVTPSQRRLVRVVKRLDEEKKKPPLNPFGSTPFSDQLAAAGQFGQEPSEGQQVFSSRLGQGLQRGFQAAEKQLFPGEPLRDIASAAEIATSGFRGAFPIAERTITVPSATRWPTDPEGREAFEKAFKAGDIPAEGQEFRDAQGEAIAPFLRGEASLTDTAKRLLEVGRATTGPEAWGADFFNPAFWVSTYAVPLRLARPLAAEVARLAPVVGKVATRGAEVAAPIAREAALGPARLLTGIPEGAGKPRIRRTVQPPVGAAEEGLSKDVTERVLRVSRGPFGGVHEFSKGIQTGRFLGKNLTEAKKVAREEGFDFIDMVEGIQRPRARRIPIGGKAADAEIARGQAELPIPTAPRARVRRAEAKPVAAGREDEILAELKRLERSEALHSSQYARTVPPWRTEPSPNYGSPVKPTSPAGRSWLRQSRNDVRADELIQELQTIRAAETVTPATLERGAGAPTVPVPAAGQGQPPTAPAAPVARPGRQPLPRPMPAPGRPGRPQRALPPSRVLARHPGEALAVPERPQPGVLVREPIPLGAAAARYPGQPIPVGPQAAAAGSPPPVKPPVGVPPGAAQPSGLPPPDTSFDQAKAKLLTFLRGSARRARGETEQLQAIERRKRGGPIEKIRARTDLSPMARFRMIRAAERGQLPVGELQLPIERLTDAEADVLGNAIFAAFPHKGMTAANTYDAFRGLILNGKIPTRGEIADLETVFGPEVVKELLRVRSLGAKVWENFVDVANLPRSILSSIDLSAPLRQGAVLGVAHPKEWGGAFKDMLVALKSEKNALSVDAMTKADIDFQMAETAGLYQTPWSIGAQLTAREETFVSRAARNIPVLGIGIRASERTYVTFLNRLRFQVFKSVVNGWRKAGKQFTDRDLETLADFINAASGRGTLGKGERYAPLASATFFSPRLQVSRVQKITSLVTATPLVRKEVAKNLAAFYGTGATLLGLAALLGADVELDPRSPNFGRIRIGATTLDFWAGDQPIARYLAQFISDERKVLTGPNRGDIAPVQGSRAATLGRFARTKLAPAPAAFLDYLAGENLIGEPVPASVGKELVNRFLPFFLRDLGQAVAEHGLLGVPIAAPGFFGASVQTIPGTEPLRSTPKRAPSPAGPVRVPVGAGR